jgi:hypothetical protein
VVTTSPSFTGKRKRQEKKKIHFTPPRQIEDETGGKRK